MASLSSALDIHKLYRNFLASAQFSMICRYRTREILLGTNVPTRKWSRQDFRMS